jgi:hypothetical protein
MGLIMRLGGVYETRGDSHNVLSIEATTGKLSIGTRRPQV